MIYWGNLIIIMFLVYFTYKIFNLIRSGTSNVQWLNTKLNDYRTKKVLTLEEQKEFLNLKFGKKYSNKFSWKIIFKIILSLLLFIFLFMLYNFLLSLTMWNIPLWFAILFIIIVPIIFSIFLKIIGLTDNNILVDLFWRSKK